MNDKNKKILLSSPKANAISIGIYLVIILVVPSLLTTYFPVDREVANNIKIILYIIFTVMLAGTVLQYLINYLESAISVTGRTAKINLKTNTRKIFVVHGHDEAANESVARFLAKLDLEPVILHEQKNDGETVIEKFEHHPSDVRFAVVLLTPDDVGSVKTSQEALHPRVRQDVIFELGYFVAKLGRKNVCALYKDIELPSDFSGVLYISMEAGGVWKYHLAKEMKQAGLDVDMNKI